MKFNCKVWPGATHPAFPQEVFHWAALANVRLIYRHSPPSKAIECFVDSGGHACIFHAAICRSIGIKKVEDGIKDDLRGIIGGPKVDVYWSPFRWQDSNS